MKETIITCLNGLKAHDAHISLFKDRKWLTQKLHSLNYALGTVTISDKDISEFKTNVNLFLDKTQSNSSNEEISAVIKKLIKQIDLITGHKPLQMP